MLVLHWVGDADPPVVDGLNFSTEDFPEGTFQALACEPADLYLHAHRHAVPSASSVVPLVVFGEQDPLVRVHVDLWIEPGDGNPARKIQDAVKRIWKRLNNRLCKSASDSPHIAALALAYSRQKTLAPAFDPTDPVVAHFPSLIGHSNLNEALEDLHDAGLMTRSPLDTLPQCPQCAGSRVLAREVCVFCGKATLEKSSVVHHYRCGYQGPEGDFEHEDEDGWHCPKCHHELRHYGRDYDQSGNMFQCLSCHSDMTEPEVGFRCLDCGTDTRGDRIEFRRVWQYGLTPNATMALTLLRDGKEDMILALLRGEEGVYSEVSDRGGGTDEPSSRAFKVEVRLIEGGAEADLAEGYEIVHSVLTRSMRDTDVVSTELSDATDGFVVTTKGGVADMESLMRRIETRVRQDLGDGLPIRVSARALAVPGAQPRIGDLSEDDAR